MKKDSRLDSRKINILEDYFNRSYKGENMEDIAKSHNINRKTLSLWKNSDHGKQLHNTYLKELSANSKPKYFQVLDREALKGSYKHMELYAKIHGLLAPEKKEVVTDDKRPASEKVVSKEILEDLKRRLGKDLDEEKKYEESKARRKEKLKEINELGSRNVIRFHG